ncbi:histidinol-phosphate transaminase [Gracilibacillus caseinilyticus]|uniref:Histidinol-phosphate aminotransferase n=1 Tax=Gracilibacillus caseinilyticus TaxID=2932256 RepID=A0ABY4EUU4_9BACI|nr:histidinol-phosphate transaminase [Gracilibacillus caseinilyticus]UOQ47582.1 histidinol-phosphate transaminase [Gracilibacillus caseinilyticus]
MKAKQVFQQMSPYTPGKQIEDVKKEYGLTKITKLASNENPFGYSPKVKELIPTIIDHLEIYPDGYATELRITLAEKLQVDEKQLTFGCGSDEVVDLICRTYLEPGTNTVMATPTFPQYKHNAVIQGADIVEVPLTDGHHNLDAMLSEINNQTRVVWLCSPNNPTGSLINRDQLVYFLTNCPADVMVVLDEAYYEYIESTNNPDSIDLLNDYPNLVILRTFSKAYGLANLRVGYGVSSEEIATNLNITRGPFNTTSVSQIAARCALEDEAFLIHTYEENLRNKQAFMEACSNLNLSYYDSEANFLFVKLPSSGDALFEYLLTKGFIVRSGEALGHPNGVRITIGSAEQMKELEQHLKEFLATL